VRVSRAIVIAALVLAGFGALGIRVVASGRAQLAAGDDAMARGKPAEAIRAFEASARWYLPLAPHVDDAYDRMRALASSQDPQLAIAAWRSIRAAARATRTLWTPHREDLAAADAAIAKLAAEDPEGAPIGETDDATAREAWHRVRLARDSRPSPGAAALAALGIVLWVGGAVLLARRGVGISGSLVRDAGHPALVAGVAIVVGLVCWFAGLYNA
jgi:hypothetical protein